MSRILQFGRYQVVILTMLIAVAIATAYISLSSRDNDLNVLPPDELDLSNFNLIRDTTPENVQKLRSLAETGNAKAAFLLGIMYERGFGVPESAEETFFWMNKAADGGLVAAETMLGVYFRDGVGAEKDLDKSLKHLKRAARMNDSVAMYELGSIFRTQKHGLFEPDRAFKLIQQSAILGNVRAQFALGEMWEKGEGTLRNLGRAYHWYQKSLRSGDEPAEERIAEMSQWYDLRKLDDRIVFVSLDKSGEVMFLAGEFEEGLMDVVREKFSQRTRSIVMESPGGLVEEGIQLGNFIRENKLDVYSGFECSSACAIAFLSGNERVLGSNGSLVFHAPKFALGEDSDDIARSIRQYFLSLDDKIDRSFLENVTNGRENAYATNMELIAHGVITKLVSSSLETDKCISMCPNTVNLQTNEFKMYLCAASCAALEN